VCVGQTISLSDGTPGGAWSSSNTAVATVTAGGIVSGVSGGTATISYTVATACGTAVATHAVTVNALPAISPITGTLSVCVGATTTLSDATSGGVWSSGNTAIATVGTAGTCYGVSAGTTPISYTVTNTSGCTASTITTLTVINPLVPVITPASSTTFCTGGFVGLNATTGTGYTYQWKVGGSPIAGATNASYVASTGGNYTVDMNSGSSCIGTSAAIVVTVNPSPIVTPSVSITASPGTTLCAVSAPVTFTPVPGHGGTTPSYQWLVNGSPAGTGPTYTYSPSGGDVVKCVLTSDDPCAFPDTAVNTVTITVAPAQTPSVSVAAVPGDTVCAGNSVTITPLSVFGGSAPLYTWSKNGTFTHSGSTYTLAPANGDIIVCTMVSNYFCVTAPTAISAPLTLHTEALSANTITIIAKDTEIVSGQVDTFIANALHPGPTPQYQWYINLVPVPGATSVVFITNTLAPGDMVHCKITTSDPCASPAIVLSNGVQVHVSTVGIQNVNTASGFTLTPNPNKGTFTIKGALKNPADRTTLRVTDMLGRTVYTKQLDVRRGAVDELITLPNQLAGGTYTVSITSGGEHAVFSMIVGK
jgi:hypothetical protein